MEKILIVEDDKAVQRALKRLFEREDYVVEVAPDGKSALDAFHCSPPSAVILDLRLPGLPGGAVCHVIKNEVPSLPVIVLSTKADVADEVLLLDIGADDFVTKPFGSRELLVRVRMAIQRARAAHFIDLPSRRKAAQRRSFDFGTISVDFARMEITRGHRPVTLTPHEFKILKLFIQNPERVISRDELMHVVGHGNYPSARTIDNHILHLRQKLERSHAHPVHFHSVRGAGYKFLPLT